MGILIALLFATIAVGAQFRKPEITPEAAVSQPKEVAVYYVGQLPSVTTTGTVNQTGVLQIVSQSSGVVSQLPVVPGQKVRRGQSLASLGTTYSGASAPSIQRSIAQKQYEQIKATRALQTEALNLQRSIATTSAEGAQRQREIQGAALSDTRQILELTELQLATLDQSLSVATASAELQVLRQQRAQLLSTASQLRGSIRSAEYVDSQENPPAQLEKLQQDLTLKQLEIQEQSLVLQEDVARLQLQLARIQESLLFPVAPFDGVVERVHVSVGQVVSPGQVIATLKCDILATEVIAQISPLLASQISTLEPAVLTSGATSITLYPQFISSVATSGSMHSVQFLIPQEHFYDFTDEEVVSISLPISAEGSRTSTPFIPIDSVFQTENRALVLVISAEGRAESREIVTGMVAGRFVSVLSGLDADSQVIIDRSIIAGERVIATNEPLVLSQKSEE
jgi:multidrug efflux pump subunit AcrA (membrane-fusion protein)